MNHGEVDVGVQDRLQFARRASHNLAAGIDDDRVAVFYPNSVARGVPHPITHREAGWNLIDVRAWVDTDDVAASLARDVLHRGNPAVTGRQRRRDPHVNALRVHRKSRERHVVLPADKTTYTTKRRLDDVKCRPISHAPHRA